MQSYTFENSKDDVFLMKYLFDKGAQYDCITEGEIQIANVRNKFVQQEAAAAYTFSTGTNFLTQLRKFFAVYTSPYSGAFDLLDLTV